MVQVVRPEAVIDDLLGGELTDCTGNLDVPVIDGEIEAFKERQ